MCPADASDSDDCSLVLIRPVETLLSNEKPKTVSTMTEAAKVSAVMRNSKDLRHRLRIHRNGGAAHCR